MKDNNVFYYQRAFGLALPRCEIRGVCLPKELRVQVPLRTYVCGLKMCKLPSQKKSYSTAEADILEAEGVHTLITIHSVKK